MVSIDDWMGKISDAEFRWTYRVFDLFQYPSCSACVVQDGELVYLCSDGKVLSVDAARRIMAIYVLRWSVKRRGNIGT
jgi:hypothetical protein